MQDLVGKVVGGVKIEKKLGQGGMGAVYKGTQVSLGREVAVKVISEQFMGNEQAVARFEREARSVAQLNHPNIVQVYDLGRSEEGQYYIIMEFVDGPSLSNLLKERGIFPEREATVMIQQAAKGLAAAAEKKIIHRDIKPDNLMVTSKGVVKVADFGLAKDVSSASQLTASGHIMGTPAYIAPEQGDGRTSDHRSDIYSLGATFFAMVTGEMPYTGETPIAIVMQHISAPVPDPRVKKPDLSESTCKIIRKMMAKKMEERYQSAEALIHDIDVVLGSAKDGERLIADGAFMAFDDQMTISGGGLKTASGKAETILEVSSPTPHTIDAALIKKRKAAAGRGMGFYVGAAALVALLAGGGVAAVFVFKDRQKTAEPGTTEPGANGGEKKAEPADPGAKKTEPETGKTEPGSGKTPGPGPKPEPGKGEPPVGPPKPLPPPKIDVSITTPGTGTYHRVRSLTVKGRCGVGAKSLAINGQSAELGADGSFLAKIDVPEGASEIKVTAGGDAEARGEAVVDVVVDTKPPLLSVQGFEPGKVLRTNRPRLKIAGAMSDLNPAQVSVDDAQATLNGDAFEIEVDLQEGINQMKVVGEDRVGNKAAETLRVFLDTSRPVLSLEEPPARLVQEKPEFVLKGAANEDLESLSLDGKAVRLDGKSFEAVLALQTGPNRFTLSAKDLAGNETTRALETEFRRLPASLAPGAAPGVYVHRADGAEMAEVSAASFLVGSEEGPPDERPVHEVACMAFFIDRTEVTNARYAKFLEAAQAADPRAFSHPEEPEGKTRTPAFWDDPEFNAPEQPVVGVDWFDAWAYAKWAGKSLPTEAEWEAAASAGGAPGKRMLYPWGDEAPEGRANFGDAEGATRPAGSFPKGASKLGLLDMAGNVQEWCLDAYDPAFYGTPGAREAGAVNEAKARMRVMRGGHFQSPPAQLRCSARSRFFPGGRYETVGFRCVVRMP